MSRFSKMFEGWRGERQWSAFSPEINSREFIDLSHGTLLYLENITVSFDGFKALDLSLIHI